MVPVDHTVLRPPRGRFWVLLENDGGRPRRPPAGPATRSSAALAGELLVLLLALAHVDRDRRLRDEDLVGLRAKADDAPLLDLRREHLVRPGRAVGGPQLPLGSRQLRLLLDRRH